MDKNWLIRTKSNHILGPVSKEKVVELYQNGSLKPGDEVCSGNGFWFFIREEDMVARYLLGNERQSFNPLSEAKDILTAKATPEEAPAEVTESPDITLVGNFNLDSLKEDLESSEKKSEENPSSEEGLPPTSLPENVEASEAQTSSVTEETLPSEEQKKNKPKLRTAKKTKKKVAPPTKSQSYLKFIFFFFVLLLLLLTYYRKQIIRFLFDGEMTKIHLISPVYAQGEILEPAKKKGFFEEKVELDGVSFSPEVGLNGFSVISQIDLSSFECEKLQKDTFLLGFLLFPADRFNEKFLIKIRECASSESDQGILSRWLKTLDQKPVLTAKEQQRRNLLTEVLNSPYNLITDQKLKSSLMTILIDMPEETISEVLLKSWLFLMLGNITRSDNLLKDFINTAPYYNWKKSSLNPSFYHLLGSEFLDNILDKQSKHPSDRLIFRLFCEYILNFYSEPTLIYKVRRIHTEPSSDFIKLEYVKRVAPALVNHLRLKKLSESERLKVLKNSQEISLDEQSLWHWPFFYIDPLITEAIYPTLKQWEKADQLWFIYLMQTEKIIDLWSKNSGKSFIQGRRQFLREQLEGKNFMLSLFQLIKLGDINFSLVDKVIKHQAK
ncbi:MAG TPA: hypothetical protein VKY27_03465 [Bacteriovoracaceae bacterium]|nr:hypothetical protein [Bacteriovoracaceae bacterium]